MNFVLGLLLGGVGGWVLGRRSDGHLPPHVAHGYFTGNKAPTPGPPPTLPPGACPDDFMWDPVKQECVVVLPWPIQQ